ncbi:MAG: hypothetical protein QW597_00980 [Thermoplasmataceae archaeon]
MAESKKNTRNLNEIIRETRESVLKDLPPVLVPVWQIKIRERFGINVDREIAEYVVLAAHEKGTWKKQRAARKIERILRIRGLSKEDSEKMAIQIVDLVVGTTQ